MYVYDMGIWPLYYHRYVSACEEVTRAISEQSFRRLWRQLCPDVLVMRPMFDLCFTCQQNNALILKSANHPDIEKSARLQNAVTHLEQVERERDIYREVIFMFFWKFHYFKIIDLL